MAQVNKDIVEKTLESWDGMKPAEVSPFLWTRISANIFSQEQRKLIAQPVIQLSLAVWVILIVINVSFWFSNPASYSTSSEVRSAFFSDDNPYTSQ